MEPYSPATTIVLFIVFGILLASCLVICYLALEYDSFDEAFERDDNDYYQPNRFNYNEIVADEPPRRNNAVGAQLEEALLMKVDDN